MKKLSLIVAMVLVATIGGVYATWQYATGSVASTDVALKPTIVHKSEASEKGTISATSTLALELDNVGEYKVGYTPVEGIDGHIIVTFTPATSGVDPSVAENGIEMEWYVVISDGWNYNGQPIFVASSEKTTLSGATKQDGVFRYEISAVEIMSKVTLGTGYTVASDGGSGRTASGESGFVLDTEAEFDEFHEALKADGKYITIIIKEKTNP